MYVLGIESTCDETAAAIVEDGRKVISNVISTSVKEQALYGGVVPEIASRRHAEYISATVDKALADANMTMKDVDAVAVTFAPGLIGAVLVGVNFAKGLAYAAGKPLVPVHHLRGHIAANYLTHQSLHPPFLCLVASGGHSHIVMVEDWCRYKVLGRTVDDAAGEAYDKVARTLGLPYPGGPSVAAAARDGDPHAYKLPVPHVEGKYNVSLMIQSAVSFISRPSIFLPRYSGVRPIIRPQINTARIAYMIIFISPTPLPPNTTLSIICSSGIIPPSGVRVSCMLLTVPVVKEVVVVVNIADCAMPKRTTLPSMLPMDWLSPASASAGLPCISAQ